MGLLEGEAKQGKGDNNRKRKCNRQRELIKGGEL